MRRRLHCWVWILSYCVAVVSRREDLKSSSFCTASASASFPTTPPDAPNLPWVWDIVYDPNRLVIEFTSVSRHACKVNITKWQEITKMFPEFRDQLADGDVSNVLATAGEESRFDFIGKRRPKQGILGKTVICVYKSSKNDLIVERLRSHVVYSARAWADVGPLLIRCPVPTALRYPNSFVTRFDRIAIEREPPSAVAAVGWKNSTPTLPFCSVPFISNSDERKYKLSMCTTAQRPKRKHLIEWIEYHLLIGFQHFFIYDTGKVDESIANELEASLNDYIDEGFVTIVPWPYQNCIKGMASGRTLYYGENRSFYPPRRITQTTALCSCYSRFRHTSLYMASLDIDEFLAWNTTATESRSLVKHIENIFNANMEKGAISIPSVMMKFCTSMKGIEESKSEVKHYNHGTIDRVPRLHQYRWGIPGPLFECKLIMACDRVAMYHIHSVSMLEKHQHLLDLSILGNSNFTYSLYESIESQNLQQRRLRNRTNKKRKNKRENEKSKGISIRWNRNDPDRHIIQSELVLLHYKEPPHMTRSVFGGHDLNLLLNESFKEAQDKYCYNYNDSHSLDGEATSLYPAELLNYYIGDELFHQVQGKYNQRMIR